MRREYASSLYKTALILPDCKAIANSTLGAIAWSISPGDKLGNRVKDSYTVSTGRGTEGRGGGTHAASRVHSAGDVS